MSYNSPLDRGSLPRIDYRASTGAVDPGLRLYMLRVYNFMAAGLGLTGLVAYVAVATGFYQHIAGTPLIWTALEVAFRKTRALQQRRYGDAAPAEGRYRAAGGKARLGSALDVVSSVTAAPRTPLFAAHRLRFRNRVSAV